MTNSTIRDTAYAAIFTSEVGTFNVTGSVLSNTVSHSGTGIGISTGSSWAPTIRSTQFSNFASGLSLSGFVTAVVDGATFTNVDFDVVADLDASGTTLRNTTVVGQAGRYWVTGGSLSPGHSVTWTSDIPYVHVYDQPWTIPATATLEIAAGHVVKFVNTIGPAALQVFGSLVLAGGVGSPVVVTSSADDTVGGDFAGDGAASLPATNSWQGIVVKQGGTVSLNNAEVRWAQFGINVQGTGTTVNVTNSTIRDFGSAGISSTFASGAVAVTGSLLQTGPTGLLVGGDTVATVHLSSFGGLTTGVNAFGSVRVNARQNWWSSNKGPVGTGGIIAAAGQVDTHPWCLDSQCSTFNFDTALAQVVSSLNPSTWGQPVTWTVSVSAVSPASGTPTGSVTFNDGGSTLGSVALVNGSAQFSSSITVGSHPITVAYSGDSNFATTTSSVLNQNVVGGSQVITFVGPGSGAAGSSSVLSASGGLSGNPVVFTVDGSSGAGVCATSGTNGSTVSYTTVGSCVIDANQAGDGNYTAAQQVQQTITVGKEAQMITFVGPGSAAVGGSTVLSASGGLSGNPVVFTVDALSGSGVCSITGVTVSYSAPGSCVIDANQAGNASFTAATQVQQTVMVSGGASTVGQTISFGLLADRTMKKASFTVKATASSKLAVVVSSATPEVCTVGGSKGRTVTLLKPGVCSINADQVGDTKFSPAQRVTRSFQVTKLDQTISFTGPAGQTMKKPVFVLKAKASSKLPVTLSSSTPLVCAVNASSVLLLAAGVCTISASQGGSNVFGVAPVVTRSFVVSLVSQTITFTRVSARTMGKALFDVKAKASSKLAVTLTSGTPLVCSVGGSAGRTVTLLGAGVCTLNADQPGSSVYQPASRVTNSFVVTG